MNRAEPRRAWLALLFGLVGTVLAGCQSNPEPRRDQAFVMGTLVEITGIGVSQTTFTEAAGAAFRDMRAIHDALTPTATDNALAAFNRQATTGWTALEGPLKPLLPRALSVQQASSNAFNPHLGRLVGLWGFREPPFPARPPAQAAIDDLLAAGAGERALVLRRRGDLEARLTRPGAALDLGGIAKGFALDRAARILRQKGVSDALINAGGDLRALGRRGDRPWRVGIRNPRDRDAVMAVVALKPGEAIVTSGDYERTFQREDRRYHHLLDPSTGRPARAGRQATVLGPRATEADAWSTALFVAGRDGLEQLGRTQPGLVVDGAGRAHANGAMRSRLDWQSQEVPAP